MTQASSLQALMPQLNYKYQQQGDNHFSLYFGTEHYRDRDGDQSLLLQVQDYHDQQLVSLDAFWLYEVAEAQRALFAEAALTVQWHVKSLRYELDETDGEVRGCIELPYSSDRFITYRQLKQAIAGLVGLIDDYDAFLRSVLERNQIDFSQLP